MTAAAHAQQPHGPAELERRAWRCLTGAGRALTPPELAELAGLTRGATLGFLVGWVAAGRARRTAPAGGRYAPYAALFTATASAQQPAPRPAKPAARTRHARRNSPAVPRRGPAAASRLTASNLTPEVPARV